MASLAVGTSTAERRLFPAVGPQGATAYRVCFAAVILAAVWRPWRRRPSGGGWGADWPTLLAYGASMGAMNLLFYLALRTLPFGPAVALEFLGPLAVATLTSRRAVDFLWIGLASVGLVLLLPLRGHASLDPTGVAYVLGAAACWAAYIVAGQRAGAVHGPGVTAVGMAIAAVVVVPFGVARAGAALLSPAAAGVGLAVAVLSGAVPFSLEMVALRQLPKRTFSVLLSLEPAVCAVGGWAVNGERLSAVQAAAVAVVMTASAGAAMTARACRSKQPPRGEGTGKEAEGREGQRISVGQLSARPLLGSSSPPCSSCAPAPPPKWWRPRRRVTLRSRGSLPFAGRSAIGDIMDFGTLLRFAVEKDASDVHVQAGLAPLLRLSGGLRAADVPPVTDEQLHAFLLAIAPVRFHDALDERITKGMDFSYQMPGVSRFRCSAYRTLGVVGVTMRVIKSKIRTVAELQLPPVINEIAMARRGLTLVTGTTGSGKSTTLAAMIDLINSTRPSKIISIEDPVEYLHAPKQSLITQLEVGPTRRASSRPCGKACGRTRT